MTVTTYKTINGYLRHSIILTEEKIYLQLMRVISKTVLILSLISLFSDVASEMLYPVIPVYLKEIGFSVLWIGIL